MHVDICKSKPCGKVYTSVLLRETYRENGKTKHRTILNLTKFPDD